MSTGAAPASPPRVVRADDAEAGALLASGWSVASESWGARLEVTEEVLLRCAAAVTAAESAGWELLVLGPADAGAITELDMRALVDYPVTPATRHAPPEPEALSRSLAAGERWAYGAAGPAGSLDAATVLYRSVGRETALVETDFTVTRAGVRGRGLATAVKAAAVLDLAAQGHERFATGGAGQNGASRRANEALGYVVTERWLHLVPPGDPRPSPCGSRSSTPPAGGVTTAT
ncbi:acetyltransferase [Xylanimonas oleitrophica]|uniref:Acetyltransferase n=1 Tax=Xylanimonas oleitrophica TaxID=2607479 RepID=A0A2W5WMG5_9MICO|nr:acetyltransferase [Xylanimonas oleitrophica]PZR51923.1 acetyltransferase [Xylanimonas oleitrophica]